MSTCKYCSPAVADLILELPGGALILPTQPHVAPREGGHLLVTPRSHTADRRGMAPAEALTVDLLTMIAADALRAVFGADWQNYQENGNWSPDPETGHAHVHVYGRRKDAVDQPFGEALRFPLGGDREDWQVEAPTPEQSDELRAYAQRHRNHYPHFDRGIAAVEETRG
jgi:diadenosine tetraphosphate (Ap4A) HIT family hydrolase